MSRGLRIAKSGYQAEDAEERNRRYDSNFNTFKYIRYGIIPIAAGAVPPTTYPIAHGLGYAPSFLMYALVRDNNHTNQYCLKMVNTDTGNFQALIESDKTNLYITYYSESIDSSSNYYPTWLVYLLGADDLADISS